MGKNVRNKGKIGLSKYFQAFKIGQRVSLGAESAVQKGMYRPRFYGRTGIIKAKQGNCYQVSVKDKRKDKNKERPLPKRW